MIRIINGDCRFVLPGLPAGAVNCVVTSPPYFGLRDYGTAVWEGSKDQNCKHIKGTAASKTSTLKKDGRVNFGSGAYEHSIFVPFLQVCGHCGAKRIDNQLGLEDSPDEYVHRLVNVFREVWRVLRDDGTVWLNLGDSYKEKNLLGIPWMVAFALRADGWCLRQDIIWHKPNPMPESTEDRCTKSHEYVFLLTKNKNYWYDAEAIKEPAQDWSSGGPGDGIIATKHYHPKNGGNVGLSALARKYKNGEQSLLRNRRSVWTIVTTPFPGAHFATFPPALVEPCILAGCPKGGLVLDPFGGAGTVGLVADRLGRDGLLIELNPDYAKMAENRIRCDAPMLTSVTLDTWGEDDGLVSDGEISPCERTGEGLENRV